MNKSFYLAFFILALHVAYAAPQAPGQNQRTQIASQASQAGQSGQSGASAQANASGPVQNSSPASVPGGTTDESGGAPAGSAGVSTGNARIPESPQSSAPAISSSELQSHIQRALDKEPTLAGEQVNVIVSGRSIDLSGKVGNARQKLTATRIVQSYAENRKIVNNLTIGNTNGKTAGLPAAGESGNKINHSGKPDLSSHPEPEKGSAPGTYTRPPQ